jgi:CBS domain-containing protein
LPIRGITLFIFGGVAEMEGEPRSPKAEFLMAIAGPIASFLLALTFYGFSVFGEALGLPRTVVGVTRYLALINGMLATFNLLPAFPLDGGRVLRSALWRWKGDLRWATHIAAQSGSGFGMLLIVLGLINVLTGNFVPGMWWFLLGLFLRGAAAASYRQLMTRRALEGEPVRRFMTPEPMTVPPETTLRELVEDHIYRYHHDLFPVTEDLRLLGCVSTRQVKQVPREKWDRVTVREVIIPCSPVNTIGPDEDALKVLALIRRTGNSRLMVVEDERLVGIIALKDMLAFLSLKMDLESIG